MEKTRYFLVPEKLWRWDSYKLGGYLIDDSIIIEIPNFCYYGENTKIDVEDYAEEVLSQLLQQLKNPNSELHDVIAKIRKEKFPYTMSNVDGSWGDEKIVQTMVYGDEGEHSIIEGYWYVSDVTYNVAKNAVFIKTF